MALPAHLSPAPRTVSDLALQQAPSSGPARAALPTVGTSRSSGSLQGEGVWMLCVQVKAVWGMPHPVPSTEPVLWTPGPGPGP